MSASSPPAAAAAPAPDALPGPAGWMPLVVLTGINTINYLDRYLVTALLPNLQPELHLTDSQGGLLGTAFMVVYFVASPFFGWAGDRGRRTTWLGGGVAVWSLATAAAGLATQFSGLFAARALVGVGEAGYGSIAPALLADFFPKTRRARVLAYFYTAVPVGSALGYLLGGVLGQALGWRAAFMVVGLPGLALAWVATRLPDPRRAGAPLHTADADADADPPLPLASVYRSLVKNRLYVGTVAGLTAYTFALGGLAFWTPSYMLRVRGYPQAQGMVLFGGITVLTGVAGTLAGGWIGDRLLRRTRKAYTWLNATSMLGAAGATVASLLVASNAAYLVWLVVAQLCMFLSFGPCNALIVDAAGPRARASAMALSIFCIHLGGDAISPTLMGWLSDAAGGGSAGLRQAMLAVPAFFVLAGLLWASTLPRRRRP